MPHVLVAGSTGSGKSVAIHSLLISLLYKNTPETLRLLLVDPKRVELAPYNGLPHLVSNVITKPKKAIMALRWAAVEMERRYEEMEKVKSRDIESYNKKALKNNEELMPYIVIVIDELADLMSTFGREVEASIVRLAQMARATGIHLIISTQRPSTDVITGLIKANIPARLALKVASQIDSRTILDSAGAEKLLGQGDLLLLTGETGKPKRIQGAFVSEGEIGRISKYIFANNSEYDSNKDGLDLDGNSIEMGANKTISNEISENSNIRQKFSPQINFDEVDNTNEGDELYPEAYKAVVEAEKASASFLQRRLRVGYARAARLLDLLEEKGVIGPGDGAKAREVFVDKEENYPEVEE